MKEKYTPEDEKHIPGMKKSEKDCDKKKVRKMTRKVDISKDGKKQKSY